MLINLMANVFVLLVSVLVSAIAVVLSNGLRANNLILSPTNALLGQNNLFNRQIQRSSAQQTLQRLGLQASNLAQNTAQIPLSVPSISQNHLRRLPHSVHFQAQPSAPSLGPLTSFFNNLQRNRQTINPSLLQNNAIFPKPPDNQIFPLIKPSFNVNELANAMKTLQQGLIRQQPIQRTASSLQIPNNIGATRFINELRNLLPLPAQNTVGTQSQPLQSEPATIDEAMREVAKAESPLGSDQGDPFQAGFLFDTSENSFLVEIDMKMDIRDMERKYLGQDRKRRKKRALLRQDHKLWVTRQIPYEIQSGFNFSEIGLIHQSLREYQHYTCLTFRGALPTDQYSVVFDPRATGCHSFVGRKRRRQVIGLAKGCRKRQIILHELGHAIGMFHEHSRLDRDQYLGIQYQNILGQTRYNFEKVKPQDSNSRGIPYDYRSVMHYGEKAFTSNGGMTMKTTDPRYQHVIGKASGLSFLDIMAVNTMYQCSAHCPIRPTCPPYGFVGKNCHCWCPTTDINSQITIQSCANVLRNPVESVDHLLHGFSYPRSSDPGLFNTFPKNMLQSSGTSQTSQGQSSVIPDIGQQPAQKPVTIADLFDMLNRIDQVQNPSGPSSTLPLTNQVLQELTHTNQHMTQNQNGLGILSGNNAGNLRLSGSNANQGLRGGSSFETEMRLLAIENLLKEPSRTPQQEENLLWLINESLNDVLKTTEFHMKK